MLDYFSLDRESVSIKSESSQNKSYLRRLVRSGRHDDGRNDTRFKAVDLNFLDDERVELDAILAKVGDERFFQYILDTLKVLYPKRNYNRAIEIPTEGFEIKHEKILATIHATVESIIADESNKIQNELKEIEGFIDVKEKLEEIKIRLGEVLTKDPSYDDFTKKLNQLVESHPFFKDKDEGKKSSKRKV